MVVVDVAAAAVESGGTWRFGGAETVGLEGGLARLLISAGAASRCLASSMELERWIPT